MPALESSLDDGRRSVANGSDWRWAWLSIKAHETRRASGSRGLGLGLKARRNNARPLSAARLSVVGAPSKLFEQSRPPVPSGPYG